MATSWTPDNPEPGWTMPASAGPLSVFRDNFSGDPDRTTRKGA